MVGLFFLYIYRCFFYKQTKLKKINKMSSPISQHSVSSTTCSEVDPIPKQQHKNGFLQNIVGTISCGFRIDLKLFNNIYGGQNTHNLPAVRKHCYIHSVDANLLDQRYGYIVYSTGMIVVTNMLSNHSSVFKYFLTLIISMVVRGVGAAPLPGSGLCVKFLMENFSFSISEKIFISKYLQSSGQPKYTLESCRVVQSCGHWVTLTARFIPSDPSSFKSLGTTRNFFEYCSQCSREIFVRNLTLAIQVKYPSVVISHKSLIQSSERIVSFPADHVEIIFQRSAVEDDILLVNKSAASKKRKMVANEKASEFKIRPAESFLKIFADQKVSLHVFSSGKFIITGAQTNEDIHRLIDIIKVILKYFLVD